MQFSRFTYLLSLQALSQILSLRIVLEQEVLDRLWQDIEDSFPVLVSSSRVTVKKDRDKQLFNPLSLSRTFVEELLSFFGGNGTFTKYFSLHLR